MLENPRDDDKACVALLLVFCVHFTDSTTIPKHSQWTSEIVCTLPSLAGIQLFGPDAQRFQRLQKLVAQEQQQYRDSIMSVGLALRERYMHCGARAAAQIEVRLPVALFLMCIPDWAVRGTTNG